MNLRRIEQKLTKGSSLSPPWEIPKILVISIIDKSHTRTVVDILMNRLDCNWGGFETDPVLSIVATLVVNEKTVRYCRKQCTPTSCGLTGRRCSFVQDGHYIDSDTLMG